MPSAYRFNRTNGQIRHARRYVGSVRRAEDGVRFVGRIGSHTATALTADLAFREVAALAMGYANLAALRAANAQVRARNRQRRATAVLPPVRRMRAGESLFVGTDRFFRATAPESEEELIARIQREAVENDETPLTAEQIRATWLRGGSR
jgi:hypothetical protein